MVHSTGAEDGDRSPQATEQHSGVGDLEGLTVTEKKASHSPCREGQTDTMLCGMKEDLEAFRGAWPKLKNRSRVGKKWGWVSCILSTSVCCLCCLKQRAGGLGNVLPPLCP